MTVTEFPCIDPSLTWVNADGAICARLAEFQKWRVAAPRKVPRAPWVHAAPRVSICLSVVSPTRKAG